MLKIIQNPQKNEWERIAQRNIIEDSVIEPQVLAVMEQVRVEGDKALHFFTEKFDKVKLESLRVSETEIAEAVEVLDENLKKAIETAYKNIYTFHLAQKDSIQKVEILEGISCWRKSVAIDKVGFYIPGGTAPLFSTVLMLGIPARIAGSGNTMLCTPPNKSGKIHPAILYTAWLVGIQQIFKVGGSQAIAAMGYGTESIPKADKIFGPGNQYVTTAKKLLSKEGIAIDMPAGPSELAVIADETANPAFVAADLLSQAEHGVDSQVVLITNHTQIAEQVNIEIQKQLVALPRKDIAAEALKNSYALIFEDINEGVDFSNFYAPEHLIIATKNFEILAEKISNAGSVFLGNYAPESAGDYASGTNHTLPTNHFARAFSGVSLDSFYKKITFQHLSKEGLQKIASAVETMAAAEGLEAHRKAVSIRFE